ncbi:MAG: Crp/Fnr family transcriptional regulator [Sulfurisoma sp.]|nr:Crp/Fnr family transcriptional regulator [Sulfurisoma sp.]
MGIPAIILKELEFFRQLPDAAVAGVAGAMTEKSFARREVVFNKGEAGNTLCFLMEGRLQAVDFTIDGREVGLYFVDPGDYFGEMSVIDGLPRPDFLIAVARSRVAFLSKDEARPLILNTSGLAERVLVRMARRLRSVSAQRTLLGLPNPAQRVCAQLVQLSVRTATGQKIANAPTHQELAIMVNTSRESVTRIFQVLQARQVLRRFEGDLVLNDAEYLNRVAEGQEELPKSG